MVHIFLFFTVFSHTILLPTLSPTHSSYEHRWWHRMAPKAKGEGEERRGKWKRKERTAISFPNSFLYSIRRNEIAKTHIHPYVHSHYIWWFTSLNSSLIHSCKPNEAWIIKQPQPRSTSKDPIKPKAKEQKLCLK